MKPLRVLFTTAALLACVSAFSQPVTSAPQYAERQKMIQQIQKVNRLLMANDDRTTDPEAFRAGATSPEFFEKAAPMLKEAGVSDDQVKRLSDVNAKMWALGNDDREATSPELIAKAKELIKEQKSILTPEQSKAVMQSSLKHAQEAMARYKKQRELGTSIPQQLEIPGTR